MITREDDIYTRLKTSLIQSGLYSPRREAEGGENTWRISPHPFYLSSDEIEFFQRLGHHLLKFYQVLNQFYFDSLKGKLPAWFAEYLDHGKPDDLLTYARMKRFRFQLPGILRPDVLLTDQGFAVTELDSVPGGFGLTAKLMELYGTGGSPLVGETEGGIPDLFYRMMESVAGVRGGSVGLVVSDEAQDYRSEMDFLGQVLKDKGFPVYVVHPKELIFKEEGLFVRHGDREVRLDVVYRFFELFDLRNIPKSELMMYANKKDRVKTTPPYKPFLEEKLSFALLHHPALAAFWEKGLGAETFATLTHLIPKTWILDPRPIPPYGVIAGLEIKGHPVREWSELFSLTQKERELVIKPSGFSPEAWGSRGVVVGHDVSSDEWVRTLKRGLREFPEKTSVLQVFHKSRRVRVSYFDPQTQSPATMGSRVRLTPFYFVVDEAARLGGILATLCPQDKKKIHGMADAVMIPGAVNGQKHSGSSSTGAQ